MKKLFYIKIAFFITLNIGVQVSYGQSNIDSLWNEWRNINNSDTNRLQAIHKIIWTKYIFSNPDSALYYSQLEYDLSSKIENKKIMAKALNNIGVSYYFKGEYNKAINNYIKSQKLSEKLNDKRGVANICNNIGIIYGHQGLNDKMLESYKKALAIYEEIDDNEGIAGALTNIADVYSREGEHQKALEFYNKAIIFHKKNKNTQGFSSALNAIGILYKEQANYYKALEFYNKSLNYRRKNNDLNGIAGSLVNIGVIYDIQKEFDKAISYYKQGYKIYDSTDNLYGKAYTISNLGTTYSNLNDFEKALNCFEKSLIFEKELGELEGLANTYQNIGSLYLKKGDNENALKFYNESYHLYTKIDYSVGISASLNGIGKVYYKKGNINLAIFNLEKSLKNSLKSNNFIEIKNSSEVLWEIYKQKKNHEKALKFYEIYISSRDSILSTQNQKAVIQQEFKFNYEKKVVTDSLKYEKQKALNDAENEKKVAIEKTKQKQQFIVLIIVIIATGLIFILLLIIYRRLKLTKKQKLIIEEVNEELNQTNEEILTQRDEIERQKNILEEAHQEIKDSIIYAKRIQEAILPNLEVIKKSVPNSFILYQPKDIVAGDFYWFEKIDNKIFIAVADCTGHGVPGAMVSVVCSNALTKAVLEENILDVGEILDRSRKLVIEKLAKNEEVKDGMDISLACIDFEKMKLEWAGANNPLYLLRDNEIQITKGDKEPIGYTQNPTLFTKHTFNLEIKDTIYLFTDGYADQFGGDKGKKMGYINFREKLIELSLIDIEVQKSILYTYFEEWKGSEEQIDDVCIIGIKI